MLSVFLINGAERKADLPQRIRTPLMELFSNDEYNFSVPRQWTDSGFLRKQNKAKLFFFKHLIKLHLLMGFGNIMDIKFVSFSVLEPPDLSPFRSLYENVIWL
ncbi:hypothetical protein TNCT_200501 [Trichonephila clavata]|uniref:Uncharacterized protein n=1 Tax=Trichonephila clavata TaxID=2740835 RepID=A0A8X6K9J8_TRICU|nr:hypothetical protein TNCT_200501 [Trichonephila clavata]